jgi:hypothetical protein
METALGFIWVFLLIASAILYFSVPTGSRWYAFSLNTYTVTLLAFLLNLGRVFEMFHRGHP